MKKLALFVVVLNIADALATLYAVAGGAEEINPLMRALLDVSPWLFVAIKLSGVTVCAVMLAHARAVKALVFLSVVYTAVCVNHFYGLI